MIIHLNGWPGAGKKAIGELIAARLGARFVHNHLLHDIAIVCAGYGSPERWRLYEAVRSAAYAVLARQPASETFVMTNALCRNSPREVEAWAHVVDLAIARNVPLVPVVLEVGEEELCRRVQSPERIGKKLSDPAALLSQMKAATLQRPDVPELVEIDVTETSAAVSADAIVARVHALGPVLTIATARHCGFRPQA